MIGQIGYYINGEEMAQVDITAGNEVKKVTFRSAFGYLVKGLLTM